MKKIIALILTAVTVLCLVSCGGNGNSGNGSGEGNNSATPKTSKYVFKVKNKNGYEVKIDADMSEVLSALGEPLSYFEAASCAFEGLDKTYTYAGFTVMTRPDGSKDYVNAIFLTDDSLTTAKGIYIGASADEVIAAYGETAKTDTLISYTDGNTTLNFILKNGKVVSIEYVPA